MKKLDPEYMKTPEQAWDHFKVNAFIGDVPESIEFKMQKAFKESKDDEEKWAKLLICIAVIKSFEIKKTKL